MPRMLDLIRNSEVPSNLMQAAARGSLSAPPAEMIEILVHLALHNKLFAERARLTLAGWDEKASLAAAGDPKTSAEVLEYFAAPENLRPCLLPALVENPAVGEDSLDRLAVAGSRSVIESLLTSQRVMSSPRLMQALQSNPNLRPNEISEIGRKLQTIPAAEPMAGEAQESDEVVEAAVEKYLEENAAEVEAEKDKPFQVAGAAHDEATSEAASEVAPRAAAAAAGAGSSATLSKPGVGVGAAVAAKAKKLPVPGEEKRDSTLQKISKLDIKGRIALAMRGTKEERSILVRDATKLVALAVLDSPKVTDGEVEGFALQKNVLESVLRAIPMKRKFAKNYSIMRNIVCNPRSPLDTSLPLMKGLLIHDLKNLSGNKEVSDTIRKLALRLFRQKMEKKN
jgi:hypothetical protein